MKHLKHFLTLTLMLFSVMAFSQTVTNTVTLDGSVSKDADGSISKYQWRKISGPVGDVITNAASVKATVVYTSPGIYQYELAVTDNEGAVGLDTMQVTVLKAPNQKPKANAGGDIIIQLPVNSTSMIKPEGKEETVFYLSGTLPKEYDK